MFGTVVRVLGVLALCGAGACKKASEPAPSPSAGSSTVTAAPGSAGSAARTSPATPVTPLLEETPAKVTIEGPGQWYLAQLVFKGIGELPFYLRVPPPGTNGKVYVVNGDETTVMTAEWRSEEVTVTGPWNYVNQIEAERLADGKLEGTWTRDTPLWGQVVRDFKAVPVDAPDPKARFPRRGAPGKTDVTGTWKFEFAEHGAGKGVLTQTPDGVVRGYIKPGQLGDVRFLEGTLGSGKLGLSHFNANSANLVLADVTPDGKTMKGMVSMQNVWNEKFTATKVEDFEFTNKVRLKDGKSTVTLKGLDKYKGKPTLAIIFATWCASCNDAAPYLTNLYSKYHPQGLEVLSVAYDLNDDEQLNQAQIETFRAKYKIPWEIVQVPCTTETWAKHMPPELEGWDGMPILLLVRADGTVQTVFGGWFGPATGPEGEKLRKWFEDSTKTLVANAKG